MQNFRGKSFAIPEGLSLALIMHTLHGAGLDLFEQWDVFDRICAKRPQGARTKAIEHFQELAQKVVGSKPERIVSLYQGEDAHILQGYFKMLDSFGQELCRASCEGRLECGVREFLAPVVLFHWNRIGMPYVFQSGLAAAVARELATLSRQGTPRQEMEKHGTSNA
jgi:hypothetical protein